MNLYPFREIRREQRKTRFKIGLIVSVVLSLLAMTLIHTHLNNLIMNQTSKNRLLQKNIRILNQVIITQLKTHHDANEL